ncbi:MAG TPA: ABC transporter ATP-binding protein [Pseudonocardia sp.]|uniref:ABC transporter ATP-binding protein n=1 Tax=Pseudonocardia sp. TaxID=60912 RepID=UPI002C581FCF|nr:ABC transporter ATP-binding protein [Pseudonocardia sp.]HTF52996.1 ABC transporter ATP-binding protein [Pseudonocardia sp.]
MSISLSVPGSPHLCADGIDCAMGGRRVLTDVRLSIAQGETVGVVGPNGSGKSTLLRVLAGIRPPAAGRVYLGGTPLDRIPARRRARLIALVGQEEQLPADLRVGELVALGRVPHQAPWSGPESGEREAVHRALAQVDLLYATDRPVDELSGGERRRALLARGLAQEAPLLMLDEPTNHLDVRHQLALLTLIRGLGRTVLVAMHDLNLAASACDRLVVLHDGRARPALPPSEALAPDAVLDVFGVEAVPVTHPFTGQTHLLFSARPQELP